MNTKTLEKRTVPAAKQKGVLVDLNRSVQALASHLCVYADVLRQCAMKPGSR